MRKYRFIVEMQNGRTYSVTASNQNEAEVLVHAYCILSATLYDLDVVTCEQYKMATRYCVDPTQFEREFEKAEPISLQVK